MLKESFANIKITVINEIILVKKKIYLSQELKKEIFRQCHDIKTVRY
jgi:hypothetical protein